MFADPFTVTVNGVAKALIRINQDKYSSEYLLKNALDEYRMTIRNTPNQVDKKRGVTYDRHNVELIHTVYPVAPSTRSYVRKSYFVFLNEQGDTLTDPQYITSALFAAFTAGNITKLENLES